MCAQTLSSSEGFFLKQDPVNVLKSVFKTWHFLLCVRFIFFQTKMILAFDTYYYDNKAKTVCITFIKWDDKEPCKFYTEFSDAFEPYISGEFYKRELPCILSLLKLIDLRNVEAIIVDGYVVLDDEENYGLGGYLFDKLNKAIPVIGVAKSSFAKIRKNKQEIFRGKSKKPLYITCLGMDINIAKQKIIEMNGGFRIPALLKRLDQLTREK